MEFGDPDLNTVDDYISLVRKFVEGRYIRVTTINGNWNESDYGLDNLRHKDPYFWVYRGTDIQQKLSQLLVANPSDELIYLDDIYNDDG